MTPQQTEQLGIRLSHIMNQLQLLSTTPIALTNDDYTTNQTIADLRIKLSHVDMQLFSLFRLIDLHNTTFVPKPRVSRTPTIDDLEI